MPDRPPRLDWVFQPYDPPLYFVTFNTHKRQKLLANADVHYAFICFAHEGEARGIGLGRYVIMPDHMHVFISGQLRLFPEPMDPNAEARAVESHFGCATALAVRVFRSSNSP